VIKTFRHKGLQRSFLTGSRAGIQAAHSVKLSDLLDLLHAAREIKDMNFPGSHLHQLKGRLREFWSVRVSGNWRLTFKFLDNDAYDVDYVDYH